MNLDIGELRQWIGRTEERADVVSATPVQGLGAMLDRDEPEPRPGDPLPPGAHWLYGFTPIPRQSSLAADGHARRGGFMPPVPLPRRMWAGSRLAFRHPLRVGQVLHRRSTVADVTAKAGRSGPLVFVRVRHELGDGRDVALVEEQDIVYREEAAESGRGRAVASAPASPLESPLGRDFARTIRPDPVLLFRYSALTHNGHRIHYDYRYVTEVEGYPGLVVHGPLIATLLLDLLRRNLPDARIATFAFRAVKPLFDPAPFDVCGRREDDGTVALWAEDAFGAPALEASATLVAT